MRRRKTFKKGDEESDVLRHEREHWGQKGQAEQENQPKQRIVTVPLRSLFLCILF